MLYQQKTPYIVEMTSDEESTKNKNSSDSDEELLSKSGSREKEDFSNLSAASCSVTSGHGHRQINIPTPEGTLCFFYAKVSPNKLLLKTLLQTGMILLD